MSFEEFVLISTVSDRCAERFVNRNTQVLKKSSVNYILLVLYFFD